jgi:hypothetical protein
MFIFLSAILLSIMVYRLVEVFMWGVTIVMVTGLLLASSHPEVARVLPSFFKGLFVPQLSMPRPWDPSDATKLLTAITFAGLGGFWALFYSCWIRDKGVGMAHYMGRITGPITGKPEVFPASGYIPKEDDALK